MTQFPHQQLRIALVVILGLLAHTETPTLNLQTTGDTQVVELRQYTLHPGRRDEMIELFEAEFIESQEAEGMQVIGTFRDLDRPDRFVWLRGFTDMDARAKGLTAFYGGPVWKKHGAAANATMIDSTNAMLLRAAWPGSAFPPAAGRPAKGASGKPAGLIVATIYYLPRGSDTAFAEFFQGTVRPHLEKVGLPILASYVTESSPNTFPRLPVRDDGPVFVWFSRATDARDFENKSSALRAAKVWTETAAALDKRLRAPTEVLRLRPASRSALR